MQIEEWKEVEGYTNYEVSTKGGVREKNTHREIPKMVNGGFWCTNLISDMGKSALCKVHRLVAIAFIVNTESSYFVDPIGDKLDSNVSNWTWRPKTIKPEKVVKEEEKIDYLGKEYTMTEFVILCGVARKVVRARIKSGWSSVECMIGTRNFYGEGYEDGVYWYPTKGEYEQVLAKKRAEKYLKDKEIMEEQKRVQRAIERAERKAKVHCGFGIFTNYPIKGLDGRKPLKVYYVWQGIISRCYNPEHDSYDRYGGRGCTVNEEWKYFQNFAKWYQEQQKRGMGNAHIHWHVDKDILISGNLEYGPETCCFVPDDVNTFFAGLGEDVKGCTQDKGVWKAAVCIFGSKNQRSFKTEEEGKKWYLEGKTQAAKLLLWKYGDLLEQRVIDKLSQI